MDILKVLSPDILITTGTTTLSKGLKYLLRVHKPENHFHVTSFDEVGDMFETQPQIINPNDLNGTKQDVAYSIQPTKEYLYSWTSLTKVFETKFSQLDWGNYHEFGVVNFILNQLKTDEILHFSNSMPVRYASFLKEANNSNNKLYANRGTSGIDGCTSTALGCALATKKPVFLITGDLAFFYDTNAF